MSSPPRYMGLNEFVQGICEALQQAPLKRTYSSHAALVDAVVRVVQDFLVQYLKPLSLGYQIWQGPAELDTAGIQPVYAYGAHFLPDLVVEVSGNPTLAFSIRQLRAQPSTQIRASIGEALIFSHQYPAVIAFLHGLEQGGGVNYLRDRAISENLWSSHKVRLLFFSH